MRTEVRDELHPEELFVKASRGALAPADAADLRAHLARCPACALQVDLRGEIERALAPTPADYEIGARAVERLFTSKDWGQLRAVTKPAGARRGALLATRAAAALALVLASSVAASALVLGTRGRLWGVEPERSPTIEPVGHARRDHRARAPKGDVESPPLEGTPVPEAPPAPAAIIPAPAVAAAPIAAAAPPVAAARPAGRVAPALGVPRRTLAAAEASVLAADGASELFGAAERARRAGDLLEARHLYGRLASRFPGTREELAARVLRGQMMLDELDDAAAALRSFEHYLRDEPAGTLAEEALVGRAQALRRLGRGPEEAAAWTDLLSRYPRSVHAELARERLAALVEAP